MVLYDDMMIRLRELAFVREPKIYEYDAQKTWPEHADYQMLFQRDMAYELGGSGFLSANVTCVTSNPAFFQGNQVIVVGPELSEMTGNGSYARICEVLVREDAGSSRGGEAAEHFAGGGEAAECLADGGEDAGSSRGGEVTGKNAEAAKLYKLLQDMDFVKFHVFPKGFMLRTSGQTGREQVRVGKDALRDGISFEKIGNTFLSHYFRHDQVLAVRMIFITDPQVDYARLQKEAVLAADIRNSLSMLQKGLPTECQSCTIQDICNEVEGLRELHFGKKKGRGKTSSLAHLDS